MRDDKRDSWIARVLGVVPPTDQPAAPDLHKAILGWRDAMEAVDRQIVALQAALRQTDDADLHEIAEYGLNAMTGGFKVRMTAAILSTEQGGAERERDQLATVASRFQTHLQSDPRVGACDDNPFGVTMRIRATLVPALEAILASLRS